MHAHHESAHEGRPLRPRAQRRAAEREEARHHSTGRRSLAAPRVLISLLLAVTVVAIAGYVGFSRLRTHANVLPALTSVAALDPSMSLIPTGRIAPGFHLTNVSGKTFSLSTQRGHPVLLEFFAVWCPVCHRETPVMAKIERTYVSKGVRIWAILANPYGPNYELSARRDLSRATAADLGWYARTYKARYPLLVDPQFATVNRYGAGSYPTLYVIGSTGKIEYATSGLQPYSALSRQLDRALASR